MIVVHYESALDDAARRELLYAGDVFLFGPRPSTLALCDFARGFIEDAFAPLDPLHAQDELTPEAYVDLVAPIKPKFIHHARTKGLIQDLLGDLCCGPDRTYFDVPRMRVAPHSGYLTAGVAYQFHPHRDTWYSAPLCQLNWWFPLWDIDRTSTMAFYPRCFDATLPNSSEEFDYYEWNATGRKDAAKHVTSDSRRQPKIVGEADLGEEARFVVPRGGVIVFSGEALHATVPNSSGVARFSIDMRTANLDDLICGRAAPNGDSNPSGTSLRDFMRVRDMERLPSEVVAAHERASSHHDGVLVYQP